MSVLNQSGEEQVECPLCMEPLEVDDLHFYPCTCGYQICRFCWHRIRTDENGLCPACRKAYSENPADFTPLSQEEMAQIKAQKRQRDQQRKAKATESRKHLASVRVVQRNLVFVVGLPLRLADAEVLKRHEYFGKFGKIHKVVINQSTAYAGAQGPSASAYVTYMKSDDALRAIQSVNSITIDGRVIKSSLGTTKYCSHFMKNQPCPKPDCMYLHDFGDPEASFTKEQMQEGMHQEYEKKLHENLLTRSTNNSQASSCTLDGKATSAPIPTSNVVTGKSEINYKKSSCKENTIALSSSVSSSSSTSTTSSTCENRDSWPHLHNSGTETSKKEKTGKKGKTRGGSGDKSGKDKDRKENNSGAKSESPCKTDSRHTKTEGKEFKNTSTSLQTPGDSECISPVPTENANHLHDQPLLKINSLIDDNTSFFSSNSFHKMAPSDHCSSGEESSDSIHQQNPQQILTDTLPDINTTEDWEAAFGFPRFPSSDHNGSEELGKQNDLKLPTTDAFRINFTESSNHDTNTLTNGFFDIPKYTNVFDLLLSSTKPNGYSLPPTYKSPLDCPQPPTPNLNGYSNVNGLDENMSKFFSGFQNKAKELQLQQQQHQQYPLNGFPSNGVHQHPHQGGFYPSSPLQTATDKLVLLQQKQLEEHMLNLSLQSKQGFGNGNRNYQNSIYPSHYMKDDSANFGLHNPLYVGNNVKVNKRSTEDDLGFDPIHETQKGFAELMANETSHKTHNTTGHSQINGMTHNSSGSHLPPPPGFVQNTHMNSFGSKILPFLNMSSNQQQINNSTQNNWPSSFNSQSNFVSHPQQQKNVSNTCDWEVLDPAILSSSRHYQLPSMPPVRDHQSQLGTQIPQNGTQLRSIDYGNNVFTNFAQQLQPNYNNFSHLNTQQNLNWYSNEMNTQISSPPGFRSNQTSKQQQEC